MNGRRIFALVRALGAVVLSMALLAATGFAPGRFLGGPEEVTEAAALKNGAYVEARLVYILDVIGVERRANGAIRAYYAVAPLGNRFVLVRFPASDADNMNALREATRRFLEGEASRTDFSLVVTGMAETAGEDTAALMGQWFGENGPRMVQAGVIGEIPDYGDYASGYVIRSGDVGRMSCGASLGLTALALGLLVYAAAVLVRRELGRYGERREKGG